MKETISFILDEPTYWALASGITSFLLAIILGFNKYPRRFLFIVSSLSFAFYAIFLVYLNPGAITTAIAVLSLFCSVLALIGLKERYRSKEVIIRLLVDGFSLQIMTVIIAVVSLLPEYRFSLFPSVLSALSYAQAVFAIILLVTTISKVQRRLVVKSKPNTSPTVSMLIPARNETHALAKSLDHSVDGDYNKLEILVLDDCSQDKTPAIIKDFARVGVRFIEGKLLPSGWLGKNFAYQQLYDNSSGEMLLFAGVDVRLSKTAVSTAVNYMELHELDMLTIVPQRPFVDFFSNLLQSVRVFWQLALPTSRPVLSSAWLVRRPALDRIGGFQIAANDIHPERVIAQTIPRRKHQFIISKNNLFTTRKKVSSQIDTAVRVLYPSVGGSVLVVALTILFKLSFIFTAVYALTTSTSLLIAAPFVILHIAFFLSNAKLLSPFSAVVTTLLMPLLVIAQLVLLLVSLYKYEFTSVGWKDRNICIPVLNQKTRPGL